MVKNCFTPALAALVTLMAFAPAVATATQQESLATAGLTDFTTLWVPARYRDDQHNALFIAGKLFTAPGGFTDVAGFLPMDTGYLVAVYQTAQPIDVSMVPAKTGSVAVFYMVARDGAVLNTLGTVLDAGHVVVGNTGIFVSQRTGEDLHSYSGYDIHGSIVSGPQAVRFASPAPDGGWFVQKVVNSMPNHLETVMLHQTANGTSKVLSKSAIHKRSYNRFLNTTAIFVDRPPLADSVRTGFVARVYKEHSAMSNDFADWRGYLADMNSTMNNYLGKWNVKIGSNHNTERGTAMALTARMVLFGTTDAAMGASQLAPKGFGPANYGVVDLNADKPHTSEREVFQLASAGMNTFRSLFGNNTSNLTANSHNDAYGVITPTGNILILAHKMARDKPWQAINLTTGNTLPSDEVEGFLYQYGITR